MNSTWANPATRAELERLIPAWEAICRDEPTPTNQITLERLKQRYAEMLKRNAKSSALETRPRPPALSCILSIQSALWP